MYYNYSIIKSIEDRPLECTLSSGDILYFPNMWWHATVNVDDYTAFVSTFTQEHLFVETKQQRIIY
jgi:ribosomal protein L16 Arg81 hydroxylase